MYLILPKLRIGHALQHFLRHFLRKFCLLFQSPGLGTFQGLYHSMPVWHNLQAQVGCGKREYHTWPKTHSSHESPPHTGRPASTVLLAATCCSASLRDWHPPIVNSGATLPVHSQQGSAPHYVKTLGQPAPKHCGVHQGKMVNYISIVYIVSN